MTTSGDQLAPPDVTSRPRPLLPAPISGFLPHFRTGSERSQPRGSAVPAGVAGVHGDVIGRGRAEPAQREGETGSDESSGWGRGVRTFCPGGGDKEDVRRGGTGSGIGEWPETMSRGAERGRGQAGH